MHILIALDDATYRRLEKVAPAKSKRRSAFVRAAIQKALWEAEEARTRHAYLQTPDTEPLVSDPDVWEALPYGGFDPPVFESTGKNAASARAKARPKRVRARVRSRK